MKKTNICPITSKTCNGESCAWHTLVKHKEQESVECVVHVIAAHLLNLSYITNQIDDQISKP